MSYLLEALGRGLLADLRAAFDIQLPGLVGDTPDALAARAADSPKSFDLQMRLGMACLREVRLREAEAAFERARILDPAAAQPLLGLACVHDELGQLSRAMRHLHAAQQRDAQDPAIAFGIAFCHERAGRAAEARQAYERTIELCPQLRNAYERIAAIAICAQDWSGAIEQYETLVEMEPGDLDVLLTLGSLYLQVDRPTDAVKQYQRALLIEPDGGDGKLAAADELADAGKLHEAIHTIEKLVRKYPGMAPFHVRLGDLYVKVGDDTKAVAQYRLALESQPGFLEATVKLGTQHMRQGRLVDAAVTFNRAVELNDRLMTAFVGLGVAQHGCGHVQESLATLDLAASLEPSTTLLFSETTRLQLHSEQRGAQASALDDDDPLEGLGDDGLLDVALQRHEQALAASPTHADLHYRHGLLLRQLGRFDDAIDAFRNAIAINPNYSKALVKLGICLKEAGAVDDAISAFQRALGIDTRYADVHYQLGLLFAQRQQFELAAEEFEQAAQGDFGDAAFRANLALALQSIGMVDRAAATWSAICELSHASLDEQLDMREQVLRQVKNQ
jgi:tetratricopeptide (TPR) repeat protein